MGNSSSSSSSLSQRETATTPALASVSAYENIPLLQQQLNEAEELHKRRCEELLLAEKRLKATQDRNSARVANMVDRIKRANDIDPDEVQALFNTRIAEMNERKDEELASEMDLLQTIVFPDKLQIVKKEVLQRVQAMRDEHWQQRLIELQEMEKKDIEIIRKIARSEHDIALKKVLKSFKEEVNHIEDKILEKRKRNGSIFSFLVPSRAKRSRNNDYNDDNDDDDDDDDDDETAE
jgi:hypothetical protein